MVVEKPGGAAAPAQDVSVADRFRERLEPNEKLLWSGIPRQGLMLRASDAFIIPFSLVWCGFAIFWESTVFTIGGPSFMLLWGGMFVLVGLHFVIGRFFTDAIKRRRTFYAVTNRRVIIISGIFWQNVRSLFIRGIPEMNLSEGRNGRGTITFGPTFTITFGRNSRSNASPAFEGIPGAARVMQIIRGVQESAA